MKKFIGWQLCDCCGINIQGDSEDPLKLASFEVIHPDDAARIAIALLGAGLGWRLMPIYDGDIEEPTIVRVL